MPKTTQPQLPEPHTLSSAIYNLKKALKDNKKEKQLSLEIEQAKHILLLLTDLKKDLKLTKKDTIELKKEFLEVKQEHQSLKNDFEQSKENTKQFFELINKLVMGKNYTVDHIEMLSKELARLKKEIKQLNSETGILPVIVLAEDYILLKMKDQKRSIADLEKLI